MKPWKLLVTVALALWWWACFPSSSFLHQHADPLRVVPVVHVPVEEKQKIMMQPTSRPTILIDKSPPKTTTTTTTVSSNNNGIKQNNETIRPPKIACVIYTYHGNRQLITETYTTWAQNCDYFFAYSDETWEYYHHPTTTTTTTNHQQQQQQQAADKNQQQRMRTIPLRTYPGTKDTLWNDVRNIWRDLLRRYNDSSSNFDADFVTFSGDDAFFIIPRLKRYLQRFDGKHDRLMLGGTDDYIRKSNNPWIGGAGYVITRKLIEQAALENCQPKLIPSEDFMTSTCLYRQGGVKFTDTRDDMGRGRFCRSRPNEPCFLPHGVASPDEVLLFHYTVGENRSKLYQQYYNNSFLASSSSSSI